jgi:hypothetical protein
MSDTNALQEVLKKAHYVDTTNDRAGKFGNPLILNKVFDLLVEMVNVLQHTAAAQANRLNFLTAWQQAYTTEMNQVHAFVANNGDGAGASGTVLDNATDTNASSYRSGLNTANTNYTQEMQGNNGVISNDAKSLQSVVNQTNDEVQSQTDMATAILQQLSTILTTIYQSPS